MLTLLATHYFGGASTADLPVNVGLTLMIAFMLFLIFAFDHPFSHDVGTDPHAMRAVLSTLGG